MKIKILKIFLITAVIIFAGVEALYLWAFPALINNALKSEKLTFALKNKTGLNLNYKSAFIKTYPAFAIKIFVNNFELTDSGNSAIASAENFNAAVGLPSLLLKKIKIKALEAKGFNLTVSRHADKKMYLGNYPLNIKFDPKQDIDLDIKKINILNSRIIFDDKYINQKSVFYVNNSDISYKKNKFIKLVLDAAININNIEKSQIDADFYSKMPLSKGLSSSSAKCALNIKNLNFSDYSKYLSYLLDKEIVSASGIINAQTSCTQKSEIELKASVKNFAVNMKNPLDSVKSDSEIKFNSVLSFDNSNINTRHTQIQADNWNILITGLIKKFDTKNPLLDLKAEVKDSSIHSLYHLIPSIQGDPLNVMQKFKKYGAWGIANGKLEIKGRADLPEIYGSLQAQDVYIVKDNPLVPHCKIFAEFLKDKVKVKTRVFAGYGEYVDVEGIAEMKVYGAGDFKVKSSPNVDLATAEYMLVPIHEVVGFDIGPVPYMKIKGKGNIDIHTIGTVLDGEVTGQFNFKNTTASLQGLNTQLHNANGALVFDHRDMHFYTTNAYIKKQPVKVDGKADLSGNIDFDVTSPSIDIADLFEILKTSPMLDNKKSMVAPVEAISGKVSTTIKIKGFAKDFGEVLKNQTLLISGKIDLKNSNAKIKGLPVSAKNLKGKIEFNDKDWKADLKGLAGSSPITVKGGCKEQRTDIKISGNTLKTDELLLLIAENEKTKLPQISKLPKTHSLITINAEYKSNNDNFDLNKLSAKGYFLPEANTQENTEFKIYSGNFNLQNGILSVHNFKSTLMNSDIYMDGKISDVFSKNYKADGHIHVSEFDVSLLNKLKNLNVLPDYISKLLNAYENYQGRANVNVTCKNNRLKGSIDFKDIKFNHGYFKTPVSIDTGKVVLDGEKATLNSFIAQIDNTPVFLNISIWDLDKTAKINGYFTTKLNESFVNKYINSRLTYPVKPRGDITVTTDISGNAYNLRLRPKIKLAQNADIYYMGANLGDENEEREISADINITDNNVYHIKKLDYIRYMISQNDRSYPLPVLHLNGIVQAGKKNIFIRNINVETLNNANVKIFNVIFKKSVLKNGMFNCKLNIKGNINSPVILGVLSMENLDMPLYNTVIKNASLKFKEKTIDLAAAGEILNSDFNLNSVIENRLKPPIIIDRLDIKSKKLNIDSLIDSLTLIPMPNSTLRLVGAPDNNAKLPLNISDFRIKKGSMTADDIAIRNLNANNYESSFQLGNDMILKIDKLGFDVTTGEMSGSASYEFQTGKIKANVSAFNVDSNKVATSLFEFKDQIFGNANGSIVITTRGNSETERLKNMTGYVYFEIADGKMPKLGSVEYLLRAGNFIKSGITGASISNFLDLITPIKTGHFESIKGNFALKNGVAQNIEVYSKGDNLNIYINGEYDVLQQYANMRVYGRLTKRAKNILGKIGNLSFNSLISQIPGFRLDKDDKAKLIQDLNKIPGVEFNDMQYRVFTVKIDGKIDEDKYVKNFRWIE